MYDYESRLGLEVVHHACLAGDFDAAAAVLYNRVYRGPRAAILRERGEYESTLAALEDFYPFRDFTGEPRVQHRSARRWILHETASCLHVVGRLAEAREVGNRAAIAGLSAGEYHAAAISLQNLAETHLAAGDLMACEEAAKHSMDLAIRVGDREDELVASTLLGTVLDARNAISEAARWFDRALEIARDDTQVPILYSLSGVRYANHLHARGEADDALRAAQTNAHFCLAQRWVADLALARSQAARWLGGADGLAMSDEALRSAKTAGNRLVLAEVLADRGALLENTDPGSGIAVFAQALDISTETGFRALEAQVRVGLAWVKSRLGNRSHALIDATLAYQLGDALGHARIAGEASRLVAQLSGSGEEGASDISPSSSP
jgi:tetratricopeptide (TPR) repeat protein